jgi:phospholipid transport system substrate-binding protein
MRGVQPGIPPTFKRKEFMKPIAQLIATATMAFAASAFAAPAPASNEAPDVLVKRISADVIETAKADKEIQAGNQKKVMGLVETKILPYVDSERMTALAAGRFWRQATPEQQKQLSDEFRTLLVFTYSGALSQIKNETVEFKPLRGDPADQEVEVRSQVNVTRGEPIQLNYRLAKTPNGWKIFDINVLGAWLVETYKGNFAAEISKSGIDGLIKKLADRNKQLANKPLKAPK